MRSSRALALVAVLSSVLTSALFATGPADAVAPPDVDLTWCDATTPVYPCITSAKRNGTEFFESDPVWDLSGMESTVAGSRELSLRVTRDGNSQLGADTLTDTFEIAVDVGALVPRVVTGKGQDVAVTRSSGPSGSSVTIVATPVVVSGQCDQSAWPWSCPEFADTTDAELQQEWVGYLDAVISDYAAWDDATQRDAFYGMNYFTNVAATSVPPEVIYDSADNPLLRIRMANRHFRSDGTTVVKGQGELRIPNGFLKEVYGVPNPATMTGSSLDTTLSGSGGAVTVAQESSLSAMLVTYGDVTFSGRTLRVSTGVITPTRPTQVEATRTSRHRGFVDFDPSAPRGAKVTGYAGRCAALQGDDVVAAVSDNIVRFTGLRAGVAYDCKVRAMSKAGHSRWSETVRMGWRPIDLS